MIRSLAVRQSRCALVALLGIAGVVAQGIPIAATTTGQQSRVKGLSPSSQAPSPSDVSQLRQRLVHAQNSGVPETAARAKRLAQLLDIATAKTSAERHRAIRRLPVTIVRSASRGGVVKTFIAGGKARLEVFVPATAADTPNTVIQPLDPSQGGGPFAPADEVGRWKSDGYGGCYWDSADEGPDQCDPDGRWKSDGQGGCYWDGADGGPDQCEPPPPVCNYEGETGACATEQEIEDSLILVAELEVEHAAMESETADYEQVQEEWCSIHPSECDLLPAGPSAMVPPCGETTVGALGALGQAVQSRAILWNATKGGAVLAVTASALAAKVTAAVFFTGLAGVAIAFLAECVYDTYFQEPLVDRPNELYSGDAILREGSA